MDSEPLLNSLPRAFESAGEANGKLARFKRVRVGKWSLRSSKSLSDMADLATDLLALERYEEAAEIEEFVSQNVAFKGDYNLWTWAACAIGVGVRAWRLLGENNKADRVYQPVRDHPAYIINRSSDDERLREAPDNIQRKAFRLVTRTYIMRLEDARAGRPGTEWFPVDQMESSLAEALAGIRESLEGTKRKA
jgi:hypothetical protein